MGYLQALNLMVKAYKAARGVMPKGLDLLKLKMRARQKVIDSKKVIEFPKDKITPFYKPRPTKPEGIIPVTVKGKTSKMSPEGIMNMLMKKGKDVKLGKAPKTTKVKEPVDPKLILQESEKEMAKRMMRENKEAIKRFKEKMNKPRDDKATGGLANLSKTYDNNPTLQSQFPDKQDYLDLFSSTTTTTTTPQTQTYSQMTEEAPAGIPAVKPIVPIIPQESGDSGGITTIQPRAPKEPLTFRESMAQLNLQRGVPVEEEEISFFDKIKQFSPTYQFMKAGKQLKDRGQQAIEDFFAAREAAKAAEVARIARQQLAASMGSDAGPGEGAGTFGASVNEATGARGSGTGFSDYS
jgi:hypothetical protein